MAYEGYISWLLDKVGGAANFNLNLISQLYIKEYYYILEADKNRLTDGLKLRENYVFETRDLERMDLPISVLEVLIALAQRISDDISGENDTAFWFNEMLKNLGLIDGIITDDKIVSILDIWLERTFASDGHGSPFPLKHPRKNMRKCELW